MRFGNAAPNLEITWAREVSLVWVPHLDDVQLQLFVHGDTPQPYRDGPQLVKFLSQGHSLVEAVTTANATRRGPIWKKALETEEATVRVVLLRLISALHRIFYSSSMKSSQGKPLQRGSKVHRKQGRVSID